jgi:hypothetical protein
MEVGSGECTHDPGNEQDDDDKDQPGVGDPSKNKRSRNRNRNAKKAEKAEKAEKSDNKTERQAGNNAKKAASASIAPSAHAAAKTAPMPPPAPESAVSVAGAGSNKVSDEQYRELHNKLREQQHLIRQLTAAKPNSSAADKALIPSSTPDGGSEKPSNKGRSKDRKKDREDRAERVAGDQRGNKQGNDTKGNKQIQVVNEPSTLASTAAANNNSKGSGLLRINPKGASNKPEKVKPTTAESKSQPQPAREAREGVDFPKRKHATPDILLRLKLDALADRSSADKPEGTKQIPQEELDMQAVSKLEASVQTAFETIKNSKELHWEICLFGLSVGASSEVSLPITKLETLYAEMLSKSLPHCILAAKSNLPQRLWVVRKKQLEIFQRVLNSTTPFYISDSDKRSQAVRAYAEEINKSKNMLSAACSSVGRWISEYTAVKQDMADDGSNLTRNQTEQSLYEGLGNLVVALGDVHRYGEQLTKKKREAGSRPAKEETREPHYHSLYQLARLLAPGFGSIYRNLTHYPRSMSNWSECVFQFLRAGSAKSAYTGDRDVLLESLDMIKRHVSSYSAVSVLSALSQDDHRDRFEGHLLNCVAIAFTRIDADAFETHAEKCKRHLAVSLQMLTSDIEGTIRSNQSQRPGKGNSSAYYEYSKSISKSANSFPAMLNSLTGASIEPSSASALNVDAAITTKIESYEGVIFRCMLVVIMTLQNIGTKPGLESITNRTADITGSAGNLSVNSREMEEENMLLQQLNSSEASTVTAVSDEDRQLLMKRLSIIRLQQIQRIPGCADLCKLLLSLLSVLLSKPTAMVGSSIGDGNNPVSEAVSIVTGLRSVAAFFEWFNANKAFHILLFLHKTDWEVLETFATEYIDRLPRPKSASEQQIINDHMTDCLDEDVTVAGLTPFAPCVDRRNYSNFVRSSGISHAHIESNLFKPMRLLVADDFLVRACRLRSALHDLTDTNLYIAYDVVVPIGYDANSRQPVACKINTEQDSYLKVVNLRDASVVTSGIAAANQFAGNSSRKLLSKDEFVRGLGLSAANGGDSHKEGHHADESQAVDDPEDGDDISDISDEVERNEADEDLGEIIVGLNIDAEKAVNHSSKPSAASGILRVGNMDAVLRSKDDHEHPKARANCKASKNSSKPRHEPTGPAGSQTSRYDQSMRKSASTGSSLPLIVVDAANVAMRHGLNAKFSCKGIQIVLNFFKVSGHRVLCFLPVRRSLCIWGCVIFSICLLLITGLLLEF